MQTIRTRSPEQTLHEYLPFKEQMGITRIANITGLDCLDIPVFIACRPNSRGLSLSQGKGIDEASAKTSAFMESVESYHAERVLSPLLYCSENEIRDKYNICDTTRLPNNPARLFSKDIKIHWIESTDLFDNSKKWIPYDMVHLDYTIPLPSDSGYFLASSNGLASGNTNEEAIIHAIFEIIERDSKAFWNALSSDEKKSTKLSLESIKGTLCEPLIHHLKKKPIKFGIWDITSRAGLPSFLCRIIPDETSFTSGIRPASGMGTHFSKEIALLRAITEAAQSRLTFIAGARDDVSKASYKKYQQRDIYDSWDYSISIEGTRDYALIHELPITNPKDITQKLLNILKSIGIDELPYLALNINTIDIPVVRVSAPGAQGYFDISAKPNDSDTAKKGVYNA